MPRMSKKRKQELSLFLNDRGRVSYSACAADARIRATEARALVIDCPHYLSKRAKGGNEHG